MVLIFRNIKLGVPNGLILCPLLFVLYVNDIPKVTAYKEVMYADDTPVNSHLLDDVKLNVRKKTLPYLSRTYLSQTSII